MDSVATFLHAAGLLLYGGPLLAFAILLACGDRIHGLRAWHLDRIWRAWGPGSGLALAVLILGGVLRYWSLGHAFSWNLQDPVGRGFLLKHLLFLALWVDYTVTEIWVAEPLRRLDPGPGDPPDPGAYLAARPRLLRHVWVSAGILLAILVLSSLPRG